MDQISPSKIPKIKGLNYISKLGSAPFYQKYLYQFPNTQNTDKYVIIYKYNLSQCPPSQVKQVLEEATKLTNDYEASPLVLKIQQSDHNPESNALFFHSEEFTYQTLLKSLQGQTFRKRLEESKVVNTLLKTTSALHILDRFERNLIDIQHILTNDQFHIKLAALNLKIINQLFEDQEDKITFSLKSVEDPQNYHKVVSKILYINSPYAQQEKTWKQLKENDVSAKIAQTRQLTSLGFSDAMTPLEGICSQDIDFRGAPRILRSVIDKLLETLELNYQTDGEIFEGLFDNEQHIEQLNLNIQWLVSDAGMQDLVIKLIEQELDSIRIFNICVHNCSQFTNSGFSKVADLLRKMSKLERFSLEVVGCSYFDDHGTSDIFWALTLCKNLYSFRFSLKNCKMVRDDVMIDLNHAIFSLKFIPDIELQFLKGVRIRHQPIKDFFNLLKKKRAVAKIKLCYETDEETNNSLMLKLCQDINSIPNLHTFEFISKRCQRLGDEGLNYLSSAVFAQIGLQIVNINLGSESQISDASVETLAKEIYNIHNLKRFKFLVMDNIRVTNKSIESLFQGLGTCFKLNDIDVTFSNCSGINDEAFGNLGKSLQEIKNLKALAIRCPRCQNIDNEGLKAIEEWKNFDFAQTVTHLGFDFSSCKKLNQQGIETISKGIKLFKNIKELSLEFRYCFLESTDVQSLPMSFAPTLESLTLDFQQVTGMGSNDLISMTDSFKTLNRMKVMNLNFQDCPEINDNGTLLLFDRLEKMVDMNILKLNFSRCDISNHSIKRLVHRMNYMPKINQFGLNTQNCQYVDAESIEKVKQVLQKIDVFDIQIITNNNDYMTSGNLHLLQTAMKQYTNLKQLSIAFDQEPQILTDKGLIQFALTLDYLRELEEVSLEFKTNEDIQSDSLGELWNRFKLLDKLKVFNLKLYQFDQFCNDHIEYLAILIDSTEIEKFGLHLEDCPNSITEESFLKLVQSIEVSHIDDLSLFFVNQSNLNDADVKGLASALEKLDLIRLRLGFEKCLNISDEGAKEMMLTLSSLEKMEELSLNFDRCYKITQESFEEMGYSFFSMKKLTHLELSFEDFYSIHDAILDQWFEYFCKGLETFKLNFKRIQGITPKGFEQLFNEISKQKLKVLTFDFDGCQLIEASGIEKLCEVLKESKTLVEFNLSVNNCQLIDDNCMEELVQTCEQHPKIERFEINMNDCQGIIKLMKRIAKKKNLFGQIISIGSRGEIQRRSVRKMWKDLTFIHLADTEFQFDTFFWAQLQLFCIILFFEIIVKGFFQQFSWALSNLGATYSESVNLNRNAFSKSIETVLYSKLLNKSKANSAAVGSIGAKSQIVQAPNTPSQFSIKSQNVLLKD